ncbi:MAG: hypothetical protein ABIV94_08855 [Acidimicrobiales bacterium]
MSLQLPVKDDTRLVPPPWLRALLWIGLPLAAVGGGWLANGAGGAAGGALGATLVLLAGVLPLELGQRFSGGVRVTRERLFVGRRSVPVNALDVTTLRFEETLDVYKVFGRDQLKTNPLWLRHTVAVEGPPRRAGVCAAGRRRILGGRVNRGAPSPTSETGAARST